MADFDEKRNLEGTFAQCLTYLMFVHGTRPDGSPNTRGAPWIQARFADVLGVDDRTVRYWLDDEKAPGDLRPIERALFGENKLYDVWRMDLREAHQRAKKGKTRRPRVEQSAGLDKAASLSDPVLPASPASPSPTAQILHADIYPVPGFAGRKDLLADIKAALWQKGGNAALTNDATSAAVKGLGGVGKSVLAREYAWRARERYHGVWWVRAETEQTLIDDLIDLGSRLIPNLKEVQERDRAMHLTLDAIAGAGGDKPWLIVYDNVEKPGAIRKLTPKTSAHILITSRWPRWQDHAQELPVDVFPEETAVDFLLAERPHESREAAGRLATVLSYLPLALSHARAYCAETNLSFDDYARRLSELIQEAPEDAEYPKSVFATFSLAIAKAAEACPEAEKLMEIAACLAPERIPLDIITPDVMSEKQREKAVAALFRVSLIMHQTRDDGSLGFHVHRLVQEVTHKRLGEKIVDILPLAMRLVNEALSNDNSADNHYSWSSKLLLPHAIAILHRVPAHDKEASNTALLNFHVGGLNLAEYKYEEAEPFVARALAIVEEVHGPKHTSTVLCLERMSEVYHRQHRNAEAEPLLRRSLAIREQISGQNTPGLLAPLQNLARVCSYQGRHEEAVGLYEQSIAIAERLLGSDHRLTKVMSTNYEIYKLEMSGEFGS